MIMELANVLNVTEKQFEIHYNGMDKSTTLVTNLPYAV